MDPPDIAIIEKRTEAEKDNLLLLAPTDVWTLCRRAAASNIGS